MTIQDQGKTKKRQTATDLRRGRETWSTYIGYKSML